MVAYEWDVELVRYYDDGENDVIDHDFCDSFKDAMDIASFAAPKNHVREIVLVRRDDEKTAWAYLDGDNLPEWFEDADGRNYKRVPIRFLIEVAKFNV